VSSSSQKLQPAVTTVDELVLHFPVFYFQRCRGAMCCCGENPSRAPRKFGGSRRQATGEVASMGLISGAEVPG